MSDMEAIYQKHTLPEKVTVGNLKAEQYFNQLSEKEKSYAVYLSLASFALFPILNTSLSPNEHAIHTFLSQYVSSLSSTEINGYFSNPTPENLPMRQFIEYAACYYRFSSCYRGFGDTKIIPRISKEDLIKIVSPTPFKSLLDACIDHIYSLTPPSVRSQGLFPHGITMYYQPTQFSQLEAEDIDKILKEKNFRVENTTIVRETDCYVVKVFSIDEKKVEIGQYNGIPVFVEYGNGKEHLIKANYWLEQALPFVSGETQSKMIKNLIQHYQTGNISDHVNYSIEWVKDKTPNVESYLGFIETYRDPIGVRAEYEGFVACVDKQESVILEKFVQNSGKILKLMPYPKEYERENFEPPTYNAIQILTACMDDYPIGINIPNYDEIRMKIGFKNVTLVNMIKARSSNSTDFIPEKAKQIFIENYDQVQPLHVACHELYGHGSGILFEKQHIEKGIPDMFNPGKNVKNYYKEGQTYDGVFGTIGSSLEECRAECTAIYLMTDPRVLEIFEVDKSKFNSYILTEIYYLLRRGLMGLENYDEAHLQWRQSHARGRFAILKSCLMWSNGAISIKRNPKAKELFELNIDETRINDIRDGLEMMLKHLNYYKATAQYNAAEAFYQSLSSVDAFWLEVKRQVSNLEKEDYVFQQGKLTFTENKWSLEGVANPTPFDCAMTLINNISLASNLPK